MGTKTITIMDDAYSLLSEKKTKGESFSDVIRRMAGGKRDIMSFAGVWKDISDQRIEEMKKTINILRKATTKEMMEKVKNDRA